MAQTWIGASIAHSREGRPAQCKSISIRGVGTGDRFSTYSHAIAVKMFWQSAIVWDRRRTKSCCVRLQQWNKTTISNQDHIPTRTQSLSIRPTQTMTTANSTVNAKKTEHITANRNIKLTRNIQCNNLARRWLCVKPIPAATPIVAFPHKQYKICPIKLLCFVVLAACKRYWGGHSISSTATSLLGSIFEDLAVFVTFLRQQNPRLHKLLTVTTMRCIWDMALTSSLDRIFVTRIARRRKNRQRWCKIIEVGPLSTITKQTDRWRNFMYLHRRAEPDLISESL